MSEQDELIEELEPEDVEELDSFVDQKRNEPKKTFTPPPASSVTMEEVLEQITPGTPAECVGAIRRLYNTEINYTFFMHDCTDHGNETSCERFMQIDQERKQDKAIMKLLCGEEFEKKVQTAIKNAKKEVSA